MASQVWISQAAEGRKLKINLTAEQLERLQTGHSIQLIAEETPWENDLTESDSQGSPLRLVEIFIDASGPHSEDW